MWYCLFLLAIFACVFFFVVFIVPACSEWIQALLDRSGLRHWLTPQSFLGLAIVIVLSGLLFVGNQITSEVEFAVVILVGITSLYLIACLIILALIGLQSIVRHFNEPPWSYLNYSPPLRWDSFRPDNAVGQVYLLFVVFPFVLSWCILDWLFKELTLLFTHDEGHHPQSRVGWLISRLFAFGSLEVPVRFVPGLSLGQLLAAAVILLLSQFGLIAGAAVRVETYPNLPVEIASLVYYATIAFLIIAWCFVLTGAFHSQIIIRILVLSAATYVLGDFSWSTEFLNNNFWIEVLWLAALLYTLADLRGRKEGGVGLLRPSLTFLLVLSCVAGHLLTHLEAFETTASVVRLSYFLAPLLFLAGFDFADLSDEMSKYIGTSLMTFRPRSVLGIAAMTIVVANIYLALPEQWNMRTVVTVASQLLFGALGAHFIFAFAANERLTSIKRLTAPHGGVMALSVVLTLTHIFFAVTESASGANIPPGASRDVHFAIHTVEDATLQVAIPMDWRVQESTSSPREGQVQFAPEVYSNRTLALVVIRWIPENADKDLLVNEVNKEFQSMSSEHVEQQEFSSDANPEWRKFSFQFSPDKILHAWLKNRDHGRDWILIGGAPKQFYHSYYLKIFEKIRDNVHFGTEAHAPEPLKLAYDPKRSATQFFGFGLFPILLGVLGLNLLTRPPTESQSKLVPFTGFFLSVLGILSACVFQINDTVGENVKTPDDPLSGLQLVTAVGSLVFLIRLLFQRGHRRVDPDILLALFQLNVGILVLSALYQLYSTAISASHHSVIWQATILVVVLAWDLLMSGKHFTNGHGPLVPRYARVLLYCGYIMFVSTTVLYFAAQNVVGGDGHFRPEPLFEAESIVQQGIVWLGATFLVTNAALRIVAVSDEFGQRSDVSEQRDSISRAAYLVVLVVVVFARIFIGPDGFALVYPE